MAVDNNEATYWASKFDETDEVALTINLGSKSLVEDMQVDWEFPAKSFAVLVSTDGQHFTEIYSTSVNILSTTHISLGGRTATAVKIVMRAPHAVQGHLEGHSLYAISSIGVFANQLGSVVEDCSTAAETKDARDKFFMSQVSEYDQSSGAALGNELQSLEVK